MAKSAFLFQSARTLAFFRRNQGTLAMEAELIRNLSKAARKSGPIVVGPWLSEVGFEALYWAPFVSRCVQRFSIDPERVKVLSRGGAGLWYHGCNRHYSEIFDLVTPAEFKSENDLRTSRTRLQKQVAETDFDKRLLKLAGLDKGLEDGLWLHPRYMYRLFNGYWHMFQPLSVVDTYTLHEPRPKPALPEGTGLTPGEYVAVKFYFNDSFPDDARNRDFIARLLRSLSRKHRVVLLNTGLVLDDHSEPGRQGEGIIDLSDRIQPRDNLDFQTRILANSKAFFGTYGGFSYIAPYYGVPSVPFYSAEEKFVPTHLDAARLAFRQLRECLDGPGNGSVGFTGYRPVFVPMDVTAFGALEETILN